MDELADEFGDDPLNELLGDDLDALEQQAFQTTQAPRSQFIQPTEPQEILLSETAYGNFEDGDVDDEIIDTTRNTYSGGIVARPALPAFRPPQRTNTVTPANVPAAISTAYNRPTRVPLQRAQSVLAHRPGTQTNRSPQPLHDPPEYGAVSNGAGTESVAALQAQVQELLLERQQLQSAIQEANKQVLSKTGEIAIVRSNYDKSVREKEQKLSELQREVAASNDRHKAELEEVRKHQEQLTTESRFADHDRVVNQTRRRKQPANTSEDVIVRRPDSRVAPKDATPRKSRNMSPASVASVQHQSPSKSFSQTPRAAEKKRKRVAESPAHIVSHDGDVGMLFGDDEAFRVPEAVSSTVQGESLPDQRYDILQRFLNRRLGTEKRRTLEILAEHKLPADTSTPFSTLIFDGIAKIRSSGGIEAYSAALCALVIGLWSRCLAAKYLVPLKYLSDMVSYMLRHAPEATAAIIDDLVPLLQKTADFNLIPRFKRSLRRQALDPGTESEHVDATECLEILTQVVTVCDDDKDLLDRFWTLVRVDFLSMLLRPVQDIENIILTCRLLSHGIRADGIGPVLNDVTSQPAPGGFTKARAEDHLVDRLSALLIEIPRKPTADEFYTQVEVSEMRMEVLSLIEHLTRTEYSAAMFAQQNHAVGRLVRCMNDEFHYSMQLLHGWEGRIEVVVEATRLLYHFVYRFAESMDINEKLRAIPGGAHKYLIVLTRLAFSEGSIWGSEIDEDVVDCAHELLEDHVNPEEGEALMAAFQSGISRR